MHLNFVFRMAVARGLSWRSLIFFLFCNETFQWPRSSPLHVFPATFSIITVSAISLSTSITVEGYLTVSAKMPNLGPTWASSSSSPKQYMSQPDCMVLTQVCITLGVESILILCLLLYGGVIIKNERQDLVFYDRSGASKLCSLALLAPFQLITLCLPVLCIWFRWLHLSSPSAFNVPFSARAVTCLRLYLVNAAACK